TARCACIPVVQGPRNCLIIGSYLILPPTSQRLKFELGRTKVYRRSRRHWLLRLPCSLRRRRVPVPDRFVWQANARQDGRSRPCSQRSTPSSIAGRDASHERFHAAALVTTAIA